MKANPLELVSNAVESFSNDERAVTVSVETVLLVVLGVAMVGGLAASLGGVTDDVLPGPRGQAEMTQDGERMIISVNSLASNVEAVTVSSTAVSTGKNLDDAYTSVSGDYNTSTSGYSGDGQFDPPSAGSTMVIDGVSDGDVITVTAHAGDSSKSNKLTTRTVGPTS